VHGGGAWSGRGRLRGRVWGHCVATFATLLTRRMDREQDRRAVRARARATATSSSGSPSSRLDATGPVKGRPVEGRNCAIVQVFGRRQGRFRPSNGRRPGHQGVSRFDESSAVMAARRPAGKAHARGRSTIFLTNKLLCSYYVLDVAMENALVRSPRTRTDPADCSTAASVANRRKDDVEMLIIGPGPRRTASRRHFRRVQPLFSSVSL
jgi:hypothetical protein